jgi:hypothetical protein
MANCSSVPPGGRDSLQCLRQHVSKLSAACATAVNAIGAAPVAAPSAASQEAPATAPANPAPPASSSPAPAETPRAATVAKPAAPPPMHAPMAMSPREEAALMRNACGPDFRRYCRYVPFGGGRAVGCLIDHQAALSRNCRGALMSLQ